MGAMYTSLLDEETFGTRADLKVPEGELGSDMRRRFEEGDNLMVTVLQSCGTEMIIAIKTITVQD